MYRSEDVASTFDNLGSWLYRMHVVIGHLLLGFQARRISHTDMNTISSPRQKMQKRQLLLQ